MKHLTKYLRNYRLQCILAPLFKMLEATFELFVPLVIASMIDRITDYSITNDTSFVLRSFILLIVLGTVGLISSCTAQYFAAVAATGFSAELRHDLFGHLLGLSHSRIDELGTSTMITRMTADVNTAQNGVNMFLRLFLRSPFIVAGAVVMAFTIDARAAMIFIAVVAVLFVTVGLIMRYNIPMLKRMQGGLDEILRLTREDLSGARVIRAFTAEGRRQEQFESANSSLSGLQIRAGRVSGLLNPLTYVIINLGIVWLIYTGGIRVSAGALTTGQVVALYNYMSQILLELIKFANLIVTTNKALASAARISDVLMIPCDEPVSDSSASAETSHLQDRSVSFDHVSLRYHTGSDEALSDISFSVSPGETIGIIGPTGSGKSSLVNMIPGFYPASTGCVRIGGEDVQSLDETMLRSRIGIVPQRAMLFAGTIADNLRWGAESATDEELAEAVHLAVADDVVASKGGLSGEVEQGGRNLSGGQRQRLTIARALVRKPDILILDDSSSALDNLTDRRLRDNLRGLTYSPTVFIVSQRCASVRDADRIVVLDDGQMAGIGTHDELMSTCDAYREIYESQFGQEET